MIFAHLTKTGCVQIDRRGVRHRVPLLPIRLLDEYFTILEEVTASPDAETIAAGREKLFALCRTVLPPAMHQDLLYLRFAEAGELTKELFFGDPGKKRQKLIAKAEKARDREIDYEFAAARMLNAYPGYTLASLLELPPGIFFRLLALSPRVRADNALSELLPAISAAINGNKAFSALENAHRGYFIAPEVPDEEYTAEELSAAYERGNRAKNVIKTVRVGMTI